MLLYVGFKLNQKSMNQINSKENTLCCYECDLSCFKREHPMLVSVRFKFEQKSMNQIESKENLCCSECNSYWIKRVWIESKEYWPWQLCQLQLMSKRPDNTTQIWETVKLNCNLLLQKEFVCTCKKSGCRFLLRVRKKFLYCCPQLYTTDSAHG